MLIYFEIHPYCLHLYMLKGLIIINKIFWTFTWFPSYAIHSSFRLKFLYYLIFPLFSLVHLNFWIVPSNHVLGKSVNIVISGKANSN